MFNSSMLHFWQNDLVTKKKEKRSGFVEDLKHKQPKNIVFDTKMTGQFRFIQTTPLLWT